MELTAYERAVLLRVRSAMRFRRQLGRATAEEGLAEQVASRYPQPENSTSGKGLPIHLQTLAFLRDAGLIEHHRVFGWSLTSKGLYLSRESEFISRAPRS